MMLFKSQEMSLEFKCSLPLRNPERAGSIHHGPLPTTSMHSPPFPLVYRGEVSWDLLWAWLFVSPPGMLPRMVPRGKSRTAEKQSLLVFVSLQQGVYGKMGAESLVYIAADG